MKRNKLRFKVITVVELLIVVGACLGSLLLIENLTTSPYRKALPPTAREIREWDWDEGGIIPQDSAYGLRAKISEEEFFDYVARLNLLPYSSTKNEDVFPSWNHPSLRDEEPEWWIPTSNLENTYIFSENNLWLYAKYENGYLYVLSFNI
ncbi:MAG: hypothetical protein GY805_39520 [Chloroflexi bacterium]|nr:hypothetical protein [Chloroflexota bacterium]